MRGTWILVGRVGVGVKETGVGNMARAEKGMMNIMMVRTQGSQARTTKRNAAAGGGRLARSAAVGMQG